MTADPLRHAYEAGAASWAGGPDRVYGVLAAALVSRGPDWHGRRVLDVGAGSGTATRLLVAAGAAVVAVDAAPALLSLARARTACPVVAADVRALPFSDAVADALVAGFVLNHLSEPSDALAEASRVVRPGGWVLASTWHREDDHPVRQVVEDGLLAHGWRPPTWYADLKQRTSSRTDTADGLAAVARAGKLREVSADRVEVIVPVSPADMVDWRLGMPHTVPFLQAMSADERESLRRGLYAEAGSLPPLVCSTVMLTARTPR